MRRACLLAALLTGCGHRPPTVAPLAHPAPAVAPVHASFRDAMDDLAPASARALASGPVEPRCADALGAYLRSDWAGCLDALDGLARDPACALGDDLRAGAFLQLGDWSREVRPPFDDPAMVALIALRRAAPAASASVAEVTLPLTFSSAGAPIVPVSINGRPESVWLDSAATLTVLSDEVTARSGVSAATGPLAGVVGDSGSGKPLSVRLGLIEQLGLGAAAARSATVAIADHRDLEFSLLFVTLMKVDGILGWNVLRDLDTEIDYPAARLTLRPPTAAAGERNLLWLSHPIALATTADGRPLHLGVDTGARVSYLTPRGARKVNPSGEIGKSVRDVHIALSGREITFASMPVKTIRDSTILDGMLASDVFRQGTLRLRPSAGRIELGPSSAR
jgi:hypothetical protein